ncbi:transmembrane protein, putative (macronuclear) [Tetrahymena thermophila SB210]|uniref:Transmembrane protein, putative n=1 Tax=Tetrahymena thermophila (strain SB210) TaxID=312017 RepID=I7LUG3_TETTS|nr:transmembrane protein, putative [Tetrahymena thermophila SB210]EAR92993.3 transmembrane protein, putative [Tetrahymena thermophila SB210]|eukprot:XP_001013238.3 transmembrane protein, putative [Tetrahymena thermophila SB210]
MISFKIEFLIRLKFCLLFSQLTLVNAIGCPFWIAGSSNYSTQIQTMILLKSDPQQDFQDIAAIVYYPFTVGIFNFAKNVKYTTIEQSEDVQFYQIDKDDRQNLQVSVIHTLDAKGRIIGWNSGNGSKQSTLQIPSQIQINPKSCLNSEELIVVTWDTSNLFVIDYSSSAISDSKITIIQLKKAQITQCVSDKANRRFLLVDSQGGFFAFDINSQLFQKLFQVENFLNFQSIYTTKNQISIAYASQNGSFYVSSYKNSVLQFQNTFPSVSTQVLVSQEEDFVILIGESNLFQVWSMKQNILVYQADFQKIYCDQRDANQTSVDSTIDFTFGSINQKNQISAVSKKYIFVYSLEEKSPLLFKNQALKLTTFKWMQAFVVEDQVVVCEEQSVSTLDLKTSKFIYFMDYFDKAESSYDVAVQIQIDSDFNRIIKVDKAGNIQYWSLFDNLLEKQTGFISHNTTFFIDKSINKLIQYQTYTIPGYALISIYDYIFGKLIENIINPFGQSNLQDFVLIQDKQNKLIIGFVKQTTQYAIYKLDNSLDHSLIFSGVLQNNGFIDGEIILLEQKQQILVGINGYLAFFNYYYSSMNSNQQINLQNNTDQVISYFYLSYAQTLISIKQQNIQIYQYDGNTFNLINNLNYNVGQPLQISLVDEKQTLVLNKGNQLCFINYQNYKQEIFNLNDQYVLFYTFDGAKGLLIAVLSNSKILVIDINTANTLNQIQIYSNEIQTVDVFTGKQLVIVAYNDGQVLLYNYINNIIQSVFNNGYHADIKYLDSKYNTLVLKSDTYMFTRTLTDNCLINQIVSPNKLNSFFIDVKSGLTLMLSNQIQLYNQIKQEYISSSPTSFDLTNSYIIYSIPSQNYLFVGFANVTSNQVIVYELDTYKQIGMLNHNVSQCVTINKFFYDEYLNRLFIGCFSPGTIVVWDLSRNFQLIQVFDQIEYTDRITGIVFNPQAQLIMFLGWTWWSKTMDYYTLNYRCQIEGLFGKFDYTNKLQILWDHNGDVRIFDYNCVNLGYISAHQNWIYQSLIDEQNLILTTVSKDRYVKTWSYKSLPYPNKMYEIQLQNPLYDGFLDKDNNYVFISDFNGYIYVLTYPQLVLIKQIQVTNSQINNLYLDSMHNMLIFGCLGSNTIGYYNLIQFMQSNAYTISYTQVGVMSTLQTQQGIIFYQEGNVVQLWDYKSKQLRYGFYVTDLDIDVQSEFILIEGQTSIAALLTREQTVFFDINTLSIINVQKQKCFRHTQIQGYLICSYVNYITILDVNEYIVFQQISIDKNSSIIELKAIVPLKSFFVTTTQGYVIGYSLNLSSQQLQFNQIFNLQLLSEAIVNSLFIEQSESYILIASSLNGQIAQIVLSQELVILKQQTLLLPGISSHAHILQYTNGYVFIKRIHDFSLSLMNPYDLTLIVQVTSPCIGYSYKLDINLDLVYIIQSCLGIYQINEFSTFKLVSYGRFTSTLLQNPTNPVFTPISNKIIFINKDYFFDAYTYQIQTYRINRLNQTITLLGIYSQNFWMFGKVADYEIFDTNENIYAQLILYSGFQIAQIQLPIFGQSICQQEITSDQFAQEIKSYLVSKQALSIMSSSNSQYVAPIFISNYFNVSFSDMSLISNNGVSLPLIKSYLIQNLQLNSTQFKNNENLMFLQYKKSLNLEENIFETNQQINNDYTQIQNVTLSNNTFNDIQQYCVLEVITQTLKITDFNIIQNSDFTNQNTIVSIKTISDFNLDKFVVSLNQGFYNLAVIQNQNQGALQNTEITNNDAVQALIITQSILQILNLKLLNNKSGGLNQLNSIVNIDQKSLVNIKNSTFKNNLANYGGSIFSSQSELQIEGSFFDSDQGLQQGGSIYSTYSNLKINDSQFLNSKSKNGGCIYFENGSLILFRIDAQNSQSGESGGFAFINQATQFQISNFSSQYCKAFSDGGVLYITHSNGNNSYIVSSIFQNSQALGSGGVILLDGSDIIISKSNFLNNTAGIGGVIRYFDLKPQFLIGKGNSQRDSCKTFSKNQCKSNKAIIFGDQIASYPQFASILPSKDFDVDIKNYPNITFNNFRSGQSNFELTIQFLDEFKNQVKQIDLQNQTLVSQISQELFQEISSYNCRIYIQQSSTFLQDQIVKIEGATLVDYAYYSSKKIGCFMNNFKITGVPSKSATIQLSLNGMKTLNSTNQFISVDNIDISIYFRSCQVGEYYNSVCQGCQLQECIQCLNGTYSLIYPQIGDETQCKSCDSQKASFCELNQIALRENYWRQSNNSDDIYQCDQVSNACNGDSTKGYCQEGYIGALCQSCDDYGYVWGSEYGKVSELGKKSIECSLCSSIQNNSFKQVLILLGILLYLVFLIIESQNSNCKMCQIRIISSLNILQMGVSQFILQSTVISKIFINQFYVISALKSSIGFTFPGLFQSLFTFPETTSQPILMFLYSIDCSLSQLNFGIPIQYLRFIYISIVLPCVFLLLIYIIINLIFIGVQYFMPDQYYYTQNKYNNANMVISTIIVFSYIASQNIYQAALEIIICEKFGDTYYMKSQMDQECYNTEHKFYILFLIFPILIAVIIIYPIIMLYVLCRNNSKMFDNTSTNVIRRYGYFFQGFKRNRWWWEFIKTWYKFIILFLSTYYNSQPQIQLTTVIFVQTIYFVSLILFKPYQDFQINKLEYKSATYVLLIFWVALFEQLNDDKMYLSFIFSVTLVLLFIMMFGQLAISFIGVIFRRNYYFFLKSKYFLKIFQHISSKLVNNKLWAQKYLYKNNFLLYNLLFNQEYDPYKVFNNWSKLRRTIQKGNLVKIQIENFQKLIDSNADKLKSPKSSFSNQFNNSSNSQINQNLLISKQLSDRQNRQRQRFNINQNKMNTKSIFVKIDQEIQN